MGKVSTFSPAQQAENTTSKVVAALERLSEAFRVLLWQEATRYGLSPIQIQVLTFLLHYPEEKRTVTSLASYFNMTKATISDAVKSLEQKNYLTRKPSATDTRSHTLHLVKEGKAIARKVEKFAQPLEETLATVSEKEQGGLLEQLMQLIYQLNQQEVINTQPMCFNCQFYTVKRGHYCNLIKTSLKPADLRVDCSQFELREEEA
ncbi:MarR family winged helix-turn-helix transcriptional regulator [Chitinophaga nivalis]|uniref:MarR family winged helix-turn-helix transcriptional regulator n=1 Tax=Chitinophaga nivalis TaxID=2991709 RepID=A0ABT3IUI3_9BACT|nr:MarR family winged helix-turn-helix transcriptional regulator [Chitinophaga nivalis]MCW3462658.1 MarR family winged helix-turn-helix transcriptional regulator [Chitinophaga nivalis]MCW3487651.1 MarR family winged helix-turn-helix transcriptional regulator [Chitinophaga nivalis]